MLMIAPDRPGSLSFIVTSPSSVRVSWTVPSPRSNGIIILYELSYYQDVYVLGKTVDMIFSLMFVVVFAFYEKRLKVVVIGLPHRTVPNWLSSINVRKEFLFICLPFVCVRKICSFVLETTHQEVL